jgi:cell division protein FtsB
MHSKPPVKAPNSLGSQKISLLVRWSVVVALWSLLLSMATGQSGVSNYRELLKNRDALRDINAQLAVENQFLEERIQRLKTSKDEQIRYVKEHFGYIEAGEMVFHFPNPKRMKIPAKPLQDETSQASSASHASGKRI